MLFLYYRFILFIAFLISLNSLNCNNFSSFDNVKLYFADNNTGFNRLINLTIDKEKISLILRRSFESMFYKFLNKQEIAYKIENYENGMQIEFELKSNFENERSELEKLMTMSAVKSTRKDSNISLDSALFQFNLNKEDLISIFQLMKDLKIVYIERFKEDLNSVYFSVSDKFFIIYSDNISNLIFERGKPPQKLQDKWYYYNGIL